MTEARLVLEPWCEQESELVVAASLDDPEGHRHRLWWRLPVRWREVLTPWADPFVVALLIPMMQWRRNVFVEGKVSPSLLVANGVTHAWLGIRWGVHPLALPFLGSDHFPVQDDGAEAGRLDKIQLLAAWPEAMRHLRGCFENPGRHTNCCRGEKCIRTILSFRAAGVPRPPAFVTDVTNRQIRRVRFHQEQNAEHWLEIACGAEGRGLGDAAWVRAVYGVIRRNERRERRRWLREMFMPLRNRVRRLFRGSTLSRRELAQLARRPQTSGGQL